MNIHNTFGIQFNKKKIFDRIFIFCCLWIVLSSIFYYLWFPVLRYPDTYVYQIISTKNIFTVDFWTKSERPVGYPLLLNFFPPGGVIFLQYFIYALFSCILIYKLREKIGPFSVILISIALSSTFFMYWSSTILTESFSISFFILLFILMDQYENFGKREIVIWCLLLLFWSMLRDTNALFSIGFCVAAMAYPWIYKSTRQKLFWIGSLFTTMACIIFLAVISNPQARWQIPTVHNIGQRILTQDEATQYFVQRGLVITPEVSCFKGRWPYQCGNDISVFGEFLESGEAHRVYRSWLLTAPWQRVTEYISFLFNYYPVQYVNTEAQIPEKMQFLDLIVFKAKAFGLLCFLSLFASFVLSFNDRRFFHFFICQGGLLAVGIVAYWGDAMETTRHVFVTYFGTVVIGIYVLASLSKRIPQWTAALVRECKKKYAAIYI